MNGSTPSTNPNYYYYGAPVVPPANGAAASENGAARNEREEEDRGRSSNGHRSQQQPSHSSTRHDHGGGGGGSGVSYGGSVGSSTRHRPSDNGELVSGGGGGNEGGEGGVGVGGVNAGIEWRPRRSNGAGPTSSSNGAYFSSNGGDHFNSHQYPESSGRFDGGGNNGRGGRESGDRERDRNDRDRGEKDRGERGGKRHPSGSSFDSYGGGRNNGGEDRWSGGGGNEDRWSSGGGGGVMESAIGYWEYEPTKAEDEPKREPPPPDAEEEFPSLVGSSDVGRNSGSAIWLGKQKSQTIVSSHSTRVQLKQQNVLGGGSGSNSGVGVGGSSNGIGGGSSSSSSAKSLVPPKMSRNLLTSSDRRRPTPTSTLSATGSVSTTKSIANVIGVKESSSGPNPLSAPALMEISRIVRPLKIREEKKSQFLRALRDDSSTSSTSHSNNRENSNGGISSDNSVANGGHQQHHNHDDEEDRRQHRQQQQQHTNGGVVESTAAASNQKRRAQSTSMEEEEELEDVFPMDEGGKRNPKMGLGGVGSSSSSISTTSPSSSSSSQRRRASTSSSGASMQDSTPHLSSSLEAEQRLLREMGWEEEEEEDDDWQISEDELREVQAKIKEFHQTQHRSLTPLTLNVLATTFQAVETKSLANGFSNGISADINKASSSSSDEQCTPTDEHQCAGFDDSGSVSSTFLISGFSENNNHKSFASSSFPLNANGSSHIWSHDNSSAVSSSINGTDSNFATSSSSSFSILSNNRIWQNGGGVSGVGVVINGVGGPSSEESDSDLSDVVSD